MSKLEVEHPEPMATEEKPKPEGEREAVVDEAVREPHSPLVKQEKESESRREEELEEEEELN